MKTLIIVTFLVSSSISFGQIVPKSRFIGGSISSTLSKQADQTSHRFAFSLQPEFGEFLTEKWSVEGGFSFSYGSYKYEHSNGNDLIYNNRTISIGITIGASRYFPLSEKLYFKLSPFASAKVGQTRDLLSDSSPNYNFPVSVGISPGFMYTLNEKWMLLGNIGALQLQSTISENSKPDISFGFSLSSSISGIGFRYIIKPKS